MTLLSPLQRSSPRTGQFSPSKLPLLSNTACTAHNRLDGESHRRRPHPAPSFCLHLISIYPSHQTPTLFCNTNVLYSHSRTLQHPDKRLSVVQPSYSFVPSLHHVYQPSPRDRTQKHHECACPDVERPYRRQFNHIPYYYQVRANLTACVSP